MTVLRSNADNLSEIVDAESLDHFPSRSRVEQFVEIIEAVVAEQKPVECFIPLGKRAADDLASIVDVAGDAERSAQRAEWLALARFLEESFGPAGLQIRGYASPLPAVVDRLQLVPAILKRSQVDYIEDDVANHRRLRELPLLVRYCFHKTSRHSFDVALPLEIK
jgi:hypothetical protein